MSEETNEPKVESTEQPAKRSRTFGLKMVILVAFVSFAAAILGLALLTNIMERKQEARNPFFRVVELTDDTEDPAVWGPVYDHVRSLASEIRGRVPWVSGEDGAPHGAVLH